MNASCISGDIRAVSKDFPTDFFEEAGVFAYYDTEGYLEAMEFVRPSRPLLGKVNMFSLPFGQAASMLARLDPQVVLEEDAVLSRRLVSRYGRQTFLTEIMFPWKPSLLAAPVITMM